MTSIHRRSFLTQTTIPAAALFLGCASRKLRRSPLANTAVPRNDLLPKGADKALEVFQLTTDDIPSAHVYMEAQIFTPDSKRFIYRRASHAHDGFRYDPEFRFMLCDLENGGESMPLVSEIGAAGPSISPDGAYLYYFVGGNAGENEKVYLKRVRLDGTQREVLHVIDTKLPGTEYCVNTLYPLSTISSDGKRLAISCFLGDGETEDVPYGLLVYDLEKAEVNLVYKGLTWLNMHPQYSRSLETDASHDILIQENHGGLYDKRGMILPGKLVGGDGADIHLLRDDGTNFRTMPCGRDKKRETCQGHQCWRGQETTAVIGTWSPNPGHESKLELIEAEALPDQGHLGMETPGGWRNNLSRSFYPNPRFCHFATDIAGKRLISDSPTYRQWLLYTAEWGAGKDEPLQNWRLILNMQSSKRAHPHPFLSPDGKTGFFNSDESGIMRPYMVTGLWG